MLVKKTVFAFEGDTIEDGPNLCDTIEHEGRKWLVPIWLHNDATGTSKPERIICLDLLEHQKSNGLRFDFVLTRPMPKDAFFGHAQPLSKGIFLIVEHPSIEIDTQDISGQKN